MFKCMYLETLHCMHLCFHAHELIAINLVTWSTAVHTFHIIGTVHRTNMPVTLHMSVPMHVYHTLHIDPTLLHISIK